MTSAEWGVFAVAIIVVPILARWAWRNCARCNEDAWRPQGLRDAELAYAEQVFRSNGPVSIVAKLDRAYCHRNGLITLVELKTRQADRVYLSDIIELSAQRFALETQTREKVTPHSYVLIQQEGHSDKKMHRARLLAHAEVITLVVRRDAILAGKMEARYTVWPSLCRHCAFQNECKPHAHFGRS